MTGWTVQFTRCLTLINYNDLNKWSIVSVFRYLAHVEAGDCDSREFCGPIWSSQGVHDPHGDLICLYI